MTVPVDPEYVEELVQGIDMQKLTLAVETVASAIKLGSNQDATPQQWLQNQADCVAEEAGEFLGEWRRLQGFARRAGDRGKMLEELSDVVISALVMFWNLGENPEDHVRAKLLKIISRGYVNKDAE
jgi:NTP pyrophosphatase (non-canonical NTP hydrolase)